MPKDPDPAIAMTPLEFRSSIQLSAVFSLRMFGLFLILPIFSIHAAEYAGGQDKLLVGLALGAYGLTQAIMQLPLGIASDRWGRKIVIVSGLGVFVLGSVIAALSTTIGWIIVGRALQGAGAISAAVTALAADLTRPVHRTKVMAMIGSSIGLVFALSMVCAPILYQWIGLPGLFWMTAILALGAMGVVWFSIPEAPLQVQERGIKWHAVLHNRQLMGLNLSVFALHLIQMTMWVVVPLLLQSAGMLTPQQWQVYLPAVLVSFAVMVPAIIIAEKRGKMKQVFRLSIVSLMLVQLGLYGFSASAWTIGIVLTLFFIAFNILEAILPSWISKIAPAELRGSALGMYNMLQSMGLFAGAVLGGVIAKQFSLSAVNLTCGIIAIVWLCLTWWISPPRPDMGD